MSERILVADDEDILRTNIAALLGRRGLAVDTVADGQAALERVREEDYALVLADLRMPRLDGIGLLERIVAERPQTFVIIMTAFASVETAVGALRLGAHDYLLKPIVFEDLEQRISNLFAYRALREEVGRLRRLVSARLGYSGLVGESPAIRSVFALIDRVAPTSATVLITGDSGTGKELVARALHERSSVADREFLAVNMAALSRDMVEAQLFGHEKGAFTGADRRREGLLRSVRGGTIFLDEIGEMPLGAQAKLLRAIEAQEILPVGADRPVKAEFRLVAATNRDLEGQVAAGHFRQDLYFRLNVFRIGIPPLRERREDLPALVDHFLRLHASAQGRVGMTLSNQAMKLLLSYPWPGNVRELSNVIERACILCEGSRLEAEHLPGELLAEPGAPTGLRAAVEDFERKHIAWVLRAARGNRDRAAAMLEVDPATLYRRLGKYQLRDG